MTKLSRYCINALNKAFISFDKLVLFFWNHATRFNPQFINDRQSAVKKILKYVGWTTYFNQLQQFCVVHSWLNMSCAVAVHDLRGRALQANILQTVCNKSWNYVQRRIHCQPQNEIFTINYTCGPKGCTAATPWKTLITNLAVGNQRIKSYWNVVGRWIGDWLFTDKWQSLTI